jgi:hypothetical protein
VLYLDDVRRRGRRAARAADHARDVGGRRADRRRGRGRDAVVRHGRRVADVARPDVVVRRGFDEAGQPLLGHAADVAQPAAKRHQARRNTRETPRAERGGTVVVSRDSSGLSLARRPRLGTTEETRSKPATMGAGWLT